MNTPPLHHSRVDDYELRARSTAQSVHPHIDLEAMSVCLNLMRLSNRLIKDLEMSVYQPRGVSAAGYHLMFSLKVVGPTYPNVLARVAGVASASMSSLLRTLEKSELIQRSRDADDGRRTLIRLTAEGEQLVSGLTEETNDRDRSWTSPLSPGESLLLTELLQKMIVNRPLNAGDAARRDEMRNMLTN